MLKVRKSNATSTPESIAKFDYVRHLQKHNLSLEEIETAFKRADSIEQLSQILKTLSNQPINCSWFEPEQMSGKYLLSINLVRGHLKLRLFNRNGTPVHSGDPDPYERSN